MCESILELLDRGESYVAEAADEPTRPPAGPGQLRPYPAVGMVIVAAAVALTPDVALPDVSKHAEVAERTP